MSATLNSLLELTDEVQAAIDAGEWLRAADLEQRRRASLEAYVAEIRAGGGTVDADAELGRLYERNQRLIGDVHHHRRRVLRDASIVRTGQAAVGAYGATRAET